AGAAAFRRPLGITPDRGARRCRRLVDQFHLARAMCVVRPASLEGHAPQAAPVACERIGARHITLHLWRVRLRDPVTTYGGACRSTVRAHRSCRDRGLFSRLLSRPGYRQGTPALDLMETRLAFIHSSLPNRPLERTGFAGRSAPGRYAAKGA